MKIKKLMFLSSASLLLAPVVTGCSGGPKVEGADVVQIRCYKGGYGDQWLYTLAEEFEKTFPGKKIKIEESSSLVSDAALQELQTPDENNIDLYFTNSTILSEIIGASQKKLRTKEYTLLEPLDDVIDSKAIGFDGKEEDETIRERLFDGYIESSQYHGKVTKWNDIAFKLPWADAVTGVFYNPAILEKYDLEVPLTSNEFINCVETIASHTAADNIYPWSWSGKNAPGYWSFLYETYFAQYETVEGFKKFLKCEPESGDIKNDGYEVFQDKGILESLKAMFPLLDLNYSTDESFSKEHTKAQEEFFEGMSAFMCDGDWVFNEMKADYLNQAKDFKMLPTPILSCIGEEMGLTDAELHTVVAKIDEKCDVGTIRGSVGNKITAEQVQRVIDARSIHDSIGPGHNMYIPYSADAKETAKLFIRFMYSNDGCRVFRNKALANLPLRYETKAGDVDYPFIKSVDDVIGVENPQMISANIQYNDVRADSLMYLFNVTEWSHPGTFKQIMADKASKNPVFSPQYIYEQEASYMETSWSKYMSFVQF